MTHSINVCFSTTDKRISRAIRWFTNSEVSHCYLTFRDQTLNQIMILEADWAGFILVPWSVKPFYGRELVARYSVKVPEDKQLTAIRSMTKYLGTKYDYMRIVSMACKRFWRRADHPMENTTKLICSETVVRFLNLCEATDIPDPPAWTPQDVYEYIQSQPELFQLEEEDLEYD